MSVGDVAHVGSHPPNVAAVYNNTNGVFALPVGYDLVSISLTFYFNRNPLHLTAQYFQP